METRARYVFVGSVTLFSLLAALGFMLWLAKVQIDRTFAQYDILFDTVAGLSQNSAVRYNGVDVGKVLTIALDRANPSLVRVRIEVYASTPVRADTIATLAGQGVTGVSFVALEGGRADSDRLLAVSPERVPVITSKPSVVQELITDAPDLLAEAIALMRDIRDFTTPENSAAITAILRNVESATARIDAMATRTTQVMATAEATLARADAVLVEAEAAFASANTVIAADLPGLFAAVTSAVDDIERTADGIEVFARDGLPAITALATEARDLIASADAVIETDLPALIDVTTVTMADIGQTAASVQAFTRDGLPAFTDLVTETRDLVASANTVIAADIPGLVEVLKTAVADIGRSAAGIEAFTTNGLPAFGELASEARGLVANLGALVDRVGSDPGRFLLGNQTPVYRR